MKNRNKFIVSSLSFIAARFVYRQTFIGMEEQKNDNLKKQIRSYKDLDVYQNAYKTCIIVMKEIIPKLPPEEKYDLKDQSSRACKAVPRLIAEGFAKKHQKAGFQKYLDDAMAEANETAVCLCQIRDIYSSLVDIKLCDDLIDLYDKIGRQLFNLEMVWNKFSKIKTNDDKLNNETGGDKR